MHLSFKLINQIRKSHTVLVKNAFKLLNIDKEVAKLYPIIELICFRVENLIFHADN